MLNVPLPNSNITFENVLLPTSNNEPREILQHILLLGLPSATLFISFIVLMAVSLNF
jgi:hypothetical protein